MRPARILLIVVALVAGGMAAFLATRGGDTPPTPETVETAEVRQEPRTQVLVATGTIGLGQRMTVNDVEWIDWPQGAVRSDYITADMVPDAPQQLTGAVARFEFFPGEPIREIKLVNSRQGYLSAVISEGMRAVSIGVTAESASGGYIVPNDRVDVVLTRSNSSFSETILSNVRILAIGKRLGEVGTTSGSESPDTPSSQVFENAQIATLELTPAQAETVLNAGSAGRLALVLRSVIDFAETPSATQGRSQAIRLIRYGQEQAVVSGSYGLPPAPGGTSALSGMPVARTSLSPVFSGTSDAEPPAANSGRTELR